MDKITKKLIKHFIYIISSVVFICFIVSSIFLSSFYINQQYKMLKDNAENIYSALKNGTSIDSLSMNSSITSGIIIKNNDINFIGHSRMGMMPFLKSMNYSSLDTQGKFNNPMGEEFLYYKLQTDLGDIIILQNNKFSSEYLRVVYIILISVFLLAIIISIPLISYAGKKITDPILKLKNASSEIANGNFDADTKVNTNDEIEDLSESLSYMALNLQKKYTLQRDFIANVSHDFKTPLSIIRNYSEAISDGMLDVKEQRNYAGEIIKEVDRLNTLVMEVLQLSKLQSGSYALKKQWFNLNEFLEDCCSKFNSLARSKNINICVNSINAEIYGDANYLYRVLYNFIHNAIKFSPENSTIEISSLLQEKGIEICVKDYGDGIEKEMLPDIWNKYYKHAKSGGMGLGLAICSEILKLHNFEYGVKSTPFVETIFYFIIPKTNLKL